MKIAQLADCHLGLNYPGPTPLSRFRDIEAVLEWTADKIIEEQVDVCLIAGDCFKDAKVMLDRASQEIASIVRFLRKLVNANIEVYVISGTPSHDSTASYHLMKEMFSEDEVSIFTEPGIMYTGSTKMELGIAMLPGLNRSMLMTQDEYKGLPVEQVHRVMTEKITMLCQGMAAQMPNDKPKILMAHMTYQGADAGFTDLLMQNEPILSKEAVSSFDLVCLGHIHRPQQIDGKVFYSGPIERLSFNEENINPGFYIHEILDISDSEWNSRAIAIDSKFIATPARRYVTLDWDEFFVKDFIESNESFIYQDIKDSIVRLRYSCSEEIAKQISRKQVEKALYEAGAWFVSEIKSEVSRVDRARDSEVVESLTPIQSLAKWCSNQGIDDAESQELAHLAEQIM